MRAPGAFEGSCRQSRCQSQGLVPDVCQQFTKGQGVFTNPTSKAGLAKAPQDSHDGTSINPPVSRGQRKAWVFARVLAAVEASPAKLRLAFEASAGKTPLSTACHALLQFDGYMTDTCYTDCHIRCWRLLRRRLPSADSWRCQAKGPAASVSGTLQSCV